MAGGALGFDTLAALTVLKLKTDFPQVQLFLALPCLEQTRGWPDADVKTYNLIRQQADEVVYVSDQYYRGCMHKRNRHLVDNSEVCICYMTAAKGGTAYTVDYARQKGLHVINLALGKDDSLGECP